MTPTELAQDATVITHGGCPDGHTAAWLMRVLSPGATFIAAHHDDPVPTLDGAEIVVADFAYRRAPMTVLAERCRSMLVLDHHQTALEDLAGFEHPKVTLRFDMHRCGARMVMDHFAVPLATALGDEQWDAVRRFVAYIDDRDRWVRALPDNGAWSAGLSAYELTFEAWDEAVFASTDALIRDGRAIERSRQRLIESAVRRAVQRSIAGHTVWVTNCDPSIVSEVGGLLAEGQPFSACYTDHTEHRNWSLRSADGGIDVAHVAERFGGGGHPRASGFRTARDAWPVDDV